MSDFEVPEVPEVPAVPNIPPPPSLPPYGSTLPPSPPTYSGPPNYAPTYGYPQQPQGPKPDNFLVWAILATVLCCLPAGIVAIVYATRVDSLWLVGDAVGAEQASKNAKLWSIISIGVVTVILAGALIFALIGAAAGSSSTVNR